MRRPGPLDSAGASSLTTKGTINFFCNPFFTHIIHQRSTPSPKIPRSHSLTLHPRELCTC